MSVSQQSPRSMKRDHDSFEDLEDLERPFFVPPHVAERLQSEQTTSTSLPTPLVRVEQCKREASPARSDSGSLTDAGSATPSRSESSPVPISSSASAFTALNGIAPPPAKRVKLTFAEREMKRINKEIRDQEKAAEKSRKEAEKQAQLEEKARREAEKDAEKKRKEAEKEQKRVAQEAEKAAKEEKRRLKEEERQRLEEEKKKKERAQKTLSSFFKMPSTPGKSSAGRMSMSPAPSDPKIPGASIAIPAASTSSNAAQDASAYDKIFPAFFIQNNVTIAPLNRFERDDEAKQLLQDKIDSYIINNRSPRKQRPFDATSLFHTRCDYRRGKQCMSVREIMSDYSGNPSQLIDLTNNSQKSRTRQSIESLRQIPMKFLKFQEDVRPPYLGTYTARPVGGIARLARNPRRKDLPNTNYEYDSEAEWIEDEDAEDLNSEGEEDEDGTDDVEDMEGFLDDENDDMTNLKRLVLQGDLEPVSTGLCWENSKKRNTNVTMLAYRMDVILDRTLKSIDPFSTEYWQPAPPPPSTSGPMDPPRIPLNTMKGNNSNLNGRSTTKSVKPYFTSPFDSSMNHPVSLVHQRPSQSLSAGTAASAKPRKVLAESDLESFRAAIKGSDLSKVGLIEVLKKKFPGRPAASIKGTLELVARRVGTKEIDKRWVLIEDTGELGGV